MNPDLPAISVRELLAGNVQLASPPELFLAINRALEDPDATAQDVAHIIQHDPGLAARLLKIVNSAFYGFPSRTTSIAHAVTILGERDLRNLVLATLVVDKFSSLPNSILSMREFWIVSVRCALFAKALTDRHRLGKRLNSVFICGLLHEVGRLVIYHRIPELARAAALLMKAEGVGERSAEVRTMGFDHYEVGAELAKRWRLPEVIAITIEHHGHPQDALLFAQEAGIVTLASLLSLNARADAMDSSLWCFLSLDKTIVDAIDGEVDRQFRELFQLIYWG